MKAVWLGQAGLLIECCKKIILVDPYLSDSLSAIYPEKTRRIPIDERFLKIAPDFIICTHGHADHTDTETLGHYLNRDRSITCLAPRGAWEMLRAFGGRHNYVRFEEHSEWSEGEIHFVAVRAEHSAEGAIGILIEAEGKRIYITGDTLYNTDIFKDVLPQGKIDALFLPMNGVGNNMNMSDAARFCRVISPRVAIPIHFGMFDSIDPSSWEYENRLIPKIYEEIKL